MPSRGTIAASEYANTAEIAARPGWFQAGSSQPMTNVTTLLGELNGVWIDLSSSSGNQGIQRRFTPDLVNAVREVEFTSAIFISNKSSGPVANSDMMRLGVGSSTSSPSIVLEPRANPDTALNDQLYVNRRNAIANDSFDTGITLQNNTVLYATVRMTAESSSGANDGSAEVWINGNQVYTETGINWSTSVSNAEFNALMYAAVGSAPGFGTMYRSFMINDTLTTPLGTAPEYKHVVAAVVETVVATSYTNEGGAATSVIAMGDNDDTTYIQTTTADEQASFDFAVPASLASQPIRDIQVRLKASRGNASFNDIDVEVRNGNGFVVTASSVESINVVDPARELIEPIYVPLGAPTLDDFTLVVRNGS